MDIFFTFRLRKNLQKAQNWQVHEKNVFKDMIFCHCCQWQRMQTLSCLLIISVTIILIWLIWWYLDCITPGMLSFFPQLELSAGTTMALRAWTRSDVIGVQFWWAAMGKAESFSEWQKEWRTERLERQRWRRTEGESKTFGIINTTVKHSYREFHQR